MSSITNVLEEWYRRVAVGQRAHYLSADHFARRRYWLGIPAVMLSTIVGTSVFASLAAETEAWVQISLGLASVAAALLTSLQTFLGYAERAEKHRAAGARYGAIGRELEELRSDFQAVVPARVSSLREQLDALAMDSPDTPQSIYYKAGAGALQSPGVHPHEVGQ